MKHTIWNELEDELDYLDDERINLAIATDGEIVAIGDIGRWNGRCSGYKLFGHKISNILYPQVDGMSYCHWCSDGKDIHCTESHHDGTNYYTYRILKGNTHDEQMENLEKLFSKKLTPHRIGAFTKSLNPMVSAVYGWK